MDTLPIYPRLYALAHLNDREFEIACSADEELHMICDGRYKPGHQKFFNQLTDYLYMIRSQALFDNSLLKFQEGISWKEFYDRLTRLFNYIQAPNLPNIMAREDKLMELKILFSIGKIPNQWGANLAAENNNLEVLEWMKENNLTLPDQAGATFAASRGNLEALKWMKENNLPLPDQSGVNFLAANGRLGVLRWMKENGLLLPNQTGANLAAERGQLEVLKWMKENGLPLPTENAAYWAAQNGHTEVVNWLASQNPPILPN